MQKEIYGETSGNDKISSELTDVFISLLELANIYNIDLEIEFDKKIKNLEPQVNQCLALKIFFNQKGRSLTNSVSNIPSEF
ncbi:Hypothetical protein FNO222_0477 [Francisella orientalis]|uniref:Uncharacterized protein n=1 Tax=Francisella orientalis TaxID=299583 RepID=A0ABM5U4X7_9GAMM|nr:pyrophosphatase [Francisella orientalis str. Toba 04]AKN85224.1 hypothetical protein FNO12_0475 [Francisella orientalis FNO12]AKN86763.1 Hypothetical protein FNO24_0475 [Francisella orientalis FNO24]AKN88302.1 Hypothetical protein FNO190_0475 [Francisella orientalis]AKU05056.1 Hypothetical protein FNO01_0475 [Francisella orientalis]